MYDFDDKKYDYKAAIELKKKEATALAKKHHAKPSMNFVFDTVEDAGLFAKSVIQNKERGKAFKAAESFLYPRPSKDLTRDYSEKRQRRHSEGDAIARRSHNEQDDEEKPPPYTEFPNDDEYRPKKRRRRWSFTGLMKRIKPSKLISFARNNNSSNRSIRTVLSTSPTGDVLDEQQQRDILHQLHTGEERTSLRGGHRAEAARVAGLERIWVFRLEQEQSEQPAVWTTFDYHNQMTLTHQQDSDKGIEVFDSHIRQGQLPVLVVPRRQRGYYPMDITGNAIVTLEIACLPNTQDIQFVYRQYSP
ncbi:hypothetical protein BJV82DRAFT_675269 [Fennellomyces sp. T-0311]|nr:hypothetical protein BJV82DRAFT_675269 [Fennellomyces sp. T-0311]